MADPTKSRLLVFHPALAPYRIDLFNALAKRYQARFVFLNEDVTYQAYDQAGLRRALAAEHGFLEPGFDFAGRQFRSGVWREVSAFRPDVVVTHEFSPTTFTVAARRAQGRFPHVVWTADNPSVIRTESPLRRLARRLVLPRIDGLIVYAAETAAVYRERFALTRPIGVCPNTQAEVSLRGKLEEALPAARELAARHDLLGRRVVLYVGRLARVKRLDRLIDAFASARRESPDLVLAIVGEGPERDSLRQRARARGVERETVFAGHVEGPELFGWFRCGSVFALLSEFEPWGAVVNEALLAGIPVVCTDRAGANTLVAGDNGEVVDAGIPSRVEAALQRWVARATQLDASSLERLRPSLMTQEFAAAVEGFSAVLDAVTVHAGQRVGHAPPGHPR